MAGTSVALSGGGHRATLFGLGALMYLTDAGQHEHVTSIASVSGGSITNGYVAQSVVYSSADAADFEANVAAPLARQIANHGTLWAWAWTRVYVLLLVLVLPAVLVVPWLVPLEWYWQVLIVLAGIAFWARVLLGARGRICARAFAKTLFSPGGAATRLADTHRGIDHVFCATDLRSGEHVYFGGDFVYAYRLGKGKPGPLYLHRAVQASASLPGAFPPARFSTRQFGFQNVPPPAKAGWSKFPKRLVLADGGVYDNMAEQWAAGFARRTRTWKTLAAEHAEPEVLIVVNASEKPQWRPLGLQWVPLWSEFGALARDVDVMYVNTTSQRRRVLVERFDRAQLAGQGLRGALVSIEQSPFQVAGYFAQAGADWPNRAARAQAVLAALDPTTKEQWKRTARDNADVGTVLSALGVEVTADLLYHAYVLAMCNLHVILDYPLLPVPSRDRFVKLATEA